MYAVASSLLTDRGAERSRAACVCVCVELGWISTGSPENRVWSETEVRIQTADCCQLRLQQRHGGGFQSSSVHRCDWGFLFFKIKPQQLVPGCVLPHISSKWNLTLENS